jgi:hypothetical protein
MNTLYSNTDIGFSEITHQVHPAKVVSLSGQDVLVEYESGTIEEARVAFSCLLKPEVNDLVATVKTTDSRSFITAILERTDVHPTNIHLNSDTTISADGNLNLISGQSISSVAGTISSISEKAIHKSNDAVIDYRNSTIKGDSLHACFRSVQFISNLAVRIVNQCIEKMVSYMRHTEDYDQVKAGKISRKAAGLYSVDSSFTIMVSKKDTKIDGERIHMG